LRMLIGDEEPDSGKVKCGFGVSTVYYDQKRESLDLNATLWSTLSPGGGDTVNVGGRVRHVVSYLRDFLFEEKQATSPVKTLSGGERNRLLLARLFSKEHNLVVLDEPTNDLDVETLELLEEVLSDYDGTIILVSHDRDFLDRVVTSTIVVEGDGIIEEYPGGYSTYLEQKTDLSVLSLQKSSEIKKVTSIKRSLELKVKLGYKQQRELDNLPSIIIKLESEVKTLRETLSDNDLYSIDPDRFIQVTKKLADITSRINDAEERWLFLEEYKQGLGTANHNQVKN
jgi:ATP-binding cassette subfamily F protein uup